MSTGLGPGTDRVKKKKKKIWLLTTGPKKSRQNQGQGLISVLKGKKNKRLQGGAEKEQVRLRHTVRLVKDRLGPNQRRVVIVGLRMVCLRALWQTEREG